MRKIIKDKCECGEPTLVELDSAQSFRNDKKRPHYSDSSSSVTIFRCRSCEEPVSNTVPSANYDD
ncbi:hypothetical protein ACXHRA_20995 [Vibrio antiquarius]